VSENKWNITFVISRQKQDGERHYQSFQMEVNPDEYVLDGIERIWAFHDHSLNYRHACHHSTCGACGMVVNGVEKLTCITPIRSVTRDGGVIKVEPLRNFPVISDLVVDMSHFYQKLEKTHASQVAELKDACLPFERKLQSRSDGNFERLVDCLECGLCISVCPAAMTSNAYLGPAILAAAQQSYGQTRDPDLLDLVDCTDGVWRCHSAYECSAVCPSNVDPAWRIMDMRKQVIGYRFRSLFGKEEKLKK